MTQPSASVHYTLARVYDFDARHDMPAVLLDRLWPRGVAKARLAGVVWEKNATPSTALREWFHADPDTRFDTFRQRFTAELQADAAAQAALQRMRSMAAQHGRLTLLTAARNPAHSHLLVLQQMLAAQS